eukprot:1190912-Prorocentrum_minimum.AAC.2
MGVTWEGKGTPVGVVYRAQGLAAGRSSLPRPVRCFWARALNLRPPLPYPHSFITITVNVVYMGVAWGHVGVTRSCRSICAVHTPPAQPPPVGAQSLDNKTYKPINL